MSNVAIVQLSVTIAYLATTYACNCLYFVVSYICIINNDYYSNPTCM